MAMGLHPSVPMHRLGRRCCPSSSSSLSSGACCLSYRWHSAPAHCAASIEPYGGGVGLRTSQCHSTDDDWKMQAKIEIDRTMHILGVLNSVETAAVHSGRREQFNGVETPATTNEQSSLYEKQHSSTADKKDLFAWDHPRRRAHDATPKAAMNPETIEISDFLSTRLCLEVNACNMVSRRQQPDCNGRSYNGTKQAAVAVEHQEEVDNLGVVKEPQCRDQQAAHTTRVSPLHDSIEYTSQVNGVNTESADSRPMVAESLTPRNGSSTEKREDLLLRLPETALSMDTMSERLACVIEDVLVVDNLATATHVIHKLRGEYKDLIHACDTEVSGIDVKKESPVGHGNVICFSIYCGPEADFGDGKRCIWVDVLHSRRELLEAFKSYWEDASIKKVWHNFSFDRHVLVNHGIKVAGFYADTMHLARLWHSGRKGTEGSYSLESLTSDINVMNGVQDWDDKALTKKTSMMELFGAKKLKKDGTEGSTKVLPPVEQIQQSETLRERWICYSSADALCTWRLWESLHEKLKGRDWFFRKEQRGSMYDFYDRFWKPFGELLAEMEAHGMLVDRHYLAEIEKVACKERAISISRFRKWASKYCSNAHHINVTSDAQIRQLLFGGFKKISKTRSFKVPNTDGYIEDGKKAPLKYRNIEISGIGIKLPCEIMTTGGLPAVSMQALKNLAGKVSIDCIETEDGEDFVPEEIDSVLTSAGIEGLVGSKRGEVEDLSAYGAAYQSFNGGQEGKEACKAIAALCEVSAIDTLISSFIQPLQGGDIMGPDGRVHCSLNLNTETGRLSARRPNLQNQPALEKDRYKIRQAFVASPGNSLIVADYGQLELRLLAHLADCTSMLEAFRIGGDFHSRTAMNMYDYVRQAVEKAKVLLEWEPKPGEEKPPSPLLKDVYGAERRKAKMLNFSIAYGKTAKGLSKDWKVSMHEAQETVKLWYKDRPEVREWQEAQKKHARERHCVYTLLGRARHFPNVSSSNDFLKGRIDRAAINTPVQGSAADVAMLAMLEIGHSKELNKLGWKLLMQVHDEMILEGPTDSAPLAKELVVQAMSHPFEGKNILKVDLAVDAKYASSWYAAK